MLKNDTYPIFLLQLLREQKTIIKYAKISSFHVVIFSISLMNNEILSHERTLADARGRKGSKK